MRSSSRREAYRHLRDATLARYDATTARESRINVDWVWLFWNARKNSTNQRVAQASRNADQSNPLRKPDLSSCAIHILPHCVFSETNEVLYLPENTESARGSERAAPMSIASGVWGQAVHSEVSLRHEGSKCIHLPQSAANDDRAENHRGAADQRLCSHPH